MPPNQAMSQLQLYHFQDDNLPEILLKVNIWIGYAFVGTYSIETITDLMCTFFSLLVHPIMFHCQRQSGLNQWCCDAYRRSLSCDALSALKHHPNKGAFYNKQTPKKEQKYKEQSNTPLD